MGLDVLGSPQLARTYDLVLVEEEDRDTCRRHKFVDLGASFAA